MANGKGSRYSSQGKVFGLNIDLQLGCASFPFLVRRRGMEYFIIPLSPSSDVVPSLNLTGEKGAYVVYTKN